MTKIKLLCKLIWQEYYFNIVKLQLYKSTNNIIEKLRMQVFPEVFSDNYIIAVILCCCNFTVN